jgi:RNA polymerase II-associated protein 3
MLVSIMEIFLATLEVTKGDDDSAAKRIIIKEYMENFARIPRFNTLVLFLSKSEKLLAKSVWMAVGVDQHTGMWNGVI